MAFSAEGGATMIVNREIRTVGSKRLCSISNFSPGVPMKEPKEITHDVDQKRIIGYPKQDTNSRIT